MTVSILWFLRFARQHSHKQILIILCTQCSYALMRMKCDAIIRILFGVHSDLGFTHKINGVCVMCNTLIDGLKSN